MKMDSIGKDKNLVEAGPGGLSAFILQSGGEKLWPQLATMGFEHLNKRCF